MRFLTVATALSLLSTCLGPGAFAANRQPLDITVLSQRWEVGATGGFHQTVDAIPTASVDWVASGDASGSGNLTLTNDGTTIIFSGSANLDAIGTSAGAGGSATQSIQIDVPDYGLPMTTLLFQAEIGSSTLSAESYLYAYNFFGGFFSGYTASETGFVSDITPRQNPLSVSESTSLPSMNQYKASAFWDVVPGETITFDLEPYVSWDSSAAPASYSAVITLKIFAIAPGDADGDLTADVLDTCINVANADQIDTDGDGVGNACDCDFDNNGTCNIDDFNLFLPRFVAASDDGIGADMNGDCVVGIDDFNLFLPGFIAAEPGPKGAAARGKPPACT